MKLAAGLSLALVLLANSLALFMYVTGIPRQFAYIPWALGTLAAASLWARHVAQLRWVDIGLAGRQWKNSAAVGVLAGLVLAVPPLLFLAFPFLLAGPARYREIQTLDAPALMWRLGAEVTVATAFTEEFLFRGVLQSLFKRVLSLPLALISTNVVFASWHLVTNALTLQQNILALPFVPAVLNQVLGYVGSLVAVGVGGLALSLLRERTNHLAGSIAAHWVAVAAMTMTLYIQ